LESPYVRDRKHEGNHTGSDADARISGPKSGIVSADAADDGFVPVEGDGPANGGGPYYHNGGAKEER